MGTPCPELLDPWPLPPAFDGIGERIRREVDLIVAMPTPEAGCCGRRRRQRPDVDATDAGREGGGRRRGGWKWKWKQKVEIFQKWKWKSGNNSKVVIKSGNNSKVEMEKWKWK